jgi:hypothetical protein
MKFRQAGVRGLFVPLIALALFVPGCRNDSTEAEEGSRSDIATVEPIEGSDVARVTLSEEAARRLDIQTVPVQVIGERSRIPYAAVLYDPDGATWTYTSPEPLVFVRASIHVVRIEGNKALLSSGPPPGTEVVTVGAAELLGTEYEVGEE